MGETVRPLDLARPVLEDGPDRHRHPDGLQAVLDPDLAREAAGSAGVDVWDMIRHSRILFDRTQSSKNQPRSWPVSVSQILRNPSPAEALSAKRPRPSAGKSRRKSPVPRTVSRALRTANPFPWMTTLLVSNFWVRASDGGASIVVSFFALTPSR